MAAGSGVYVRPGAIGKRTESPKMCVRQSHAPRGMSKFTGVAGWDAPVAACRCIRPRPNGPTLPAFTPAEVDFLSETLTRAFAQAQPSEVVVFGLTSPKTQEMTEITTGAWFVKDEQLHLILGNYREAFTMASIRELLWQDPLHMIAGALYEFVPGPHQSLTREDNGIRTFLIPEAPQLALTYQQLSLGVPPVDGGHDKGSPPSAYQDSSLEGKLQRLKQMRDDGLITDDEFAAKKKALLDGF